MAWTPFIFATDAHGDCQDTAACNAMFRFMRDFKPKIRIASEFFDFRAWRTKAGPKEQDESTEPDLKAGLSLIDAFRPTHYLVANHCTRLWLRSKDAPDGRVRDLAGRYIAEIEGTLARHRCLTLPYHKRLGVLKIGHLKFLHGFYCGTTAARQHALAYGSCLFGHGHAIDSASIAGCERRVARMVGCLCDLNMSYADADVGTLRWAHGFAFGWINDKTGNFKVCQAEGVDGEWVLPTDMRVIA
jgi:hypothetical protein